MSALPRMQYLPCCTVQANTGSEVQFIILPDHVLGSVHQGLTIAELVLVHPVSAFMAYID